jgi:hypothetical protein
VSNAFPAFLVAVERALGDPSPSIDPALCREVLAIAEQHPDRVAEQVRAWLEAER